MLFNRKWLSTKDYSWVREFKGDKSKALCSICNKVFDIGAMGESALKSHMKSDKHKTSESSAAGAATGAFFVSKRSNKERSETDTSKSNGEETRVVPLPPQFNAPHAQLRGQILWTLQTVSAHNSNKSNKHVAELFNAMCPDSQIAAKFTCGEKKKTAYRSVFCLAEHFIALLKKEVNSCFATLFDESLNKKTQLQQMDIHIR